MTARRNDNGDLEVIKIGGQTYTYRAILVVLLLSLTPIGNGVWSVMGLSAPNGTGPNSTVEKRLTMVETKVDAVETKIQSVERKMDTALIDINLVSSKLTGFIGGFDKRKEGK